MALRGIKVVEILGLAPGPFCGTILADFGATVTVVQKIEPAPFDVMSNGKRMISIDLKTKEGVDIFKKLCSSSDVLIDTFRPGVMEKLGIGPETLLKNNSHLIYARLTGYGQTGPFSQKAGHDINYVAMSGILSLLAKNNQPPTAPINLLADFAGGSLTCVLGIILALYERKNSGKGQVVDVSMTDGATYLGTWLYKSRKLPIWGGPPGTNVLDGGFSSYNTYMTKDGKFMAVGALEPKFYSQFIMGLGLCEDDYSQSLNFKESHKKFAEIFLTKTQAEWCDVYKDLDACVTPVLDMESIDIHDYHINRDTFYRDSNNLIVPKPSPKLSRTPGVSVGLKPEVQPGTHTCIILKELGYTPKQINDLLKKGCIYHKKLSNL